MFLSTLRKLSSAIFLYIMFSAVSFAGITDAKFSTAQIFDVQWYINGGTLHASGFNYIYSSINYATQTASAARWTAAQTADASANGRYIAFFNSTTNPGTYGMAVYNSNGTIYKIINNTGSFRTLADGAIFYNGNGMWGTLITTKQGYNLGESGQFAITQEYPTNAQLEAYVPESTTPLGAGETSSPPPPPPPPTPIYSSSINASQSARRTAKLAETVGHNANINIVGNNNEVYVQQIGGSHYASIHIEGDSNSADTLQTTTTSARHYLEAFIDGTTNDLVLQQRDTGKNMFVGVNGSDNTLTVNQRGGGNHYLDILLIGDDHTANILQDGSGNHAATVQLENGGGPWNFVLNQSGSTSKIYNLPHGMSDGSTVSGVCNIVAGCNLTVNQ